MPVGLQEKPVHLQPGKLNRMATVSIWLKAARLRTLPLALAATGMGNLLVSNEPGFKPWVAVLSVLTTLFLQILSNFSNDYGDSVHGADHAGRKGPSRMVQSGQLSREDMKAAIVLMAVLSLASGLSLLWLSFQDDWSRLLPLLALGLLAIAAAYFYTNGKVPYGYRAMGDISVFLFFGCTAVLATSYLHTGRFESAGILPSISLGFWSTAVLNLNNMRDMPSDAQAGKQTIPLKLGLQSAKYYQSLLVLGGMLALLVFALGENQLYLLGAVPGCLLMLKAWIGTLNTADNAHLDAYLKPQALGTFLAVLGMAAVKCFLPGA